jgi:hypothetical protein
MSDLKNFDFIKLPSGISMRAPYPGELEFFKKRPDVPGMAAEDNKVIMNPFSPMKPEEFQAVANNEAARILMRKPENAPDFDLTPAQEAFLDTTDYRRATPEQRKATIAARILSGDPSAGVPTALQNAFVMKLKMKLFGDK